MIVSNIKVLLTTIIVLYYNSNLIASIIKLSPIAIKALATIVITTRIVLRKSIIVISTLIQQSISFLLRQSNCLDLE